MLQLGRSRLWLLGWVRPCCLWECAEGPDWWTGDISGYHRLEVTEAPEPEDVIWENLEESDRSLQLRRGFVNLVTFILLLISFFLIVGIYGARNRLEAVSKPMSTAMCSITLRSAAAAAARGPE